MHSRTCGISVLLFAASLLLAGQSGTSALLGRVFDATGRSLAGAIVRLEDAASGAIREVPADETGFYQAAGLLPGTYRVTASAPQLEAPTAVSVSLHVGTSSRLDFVLAPQARRESVVVVERIDSLPTRNSTLGSLLTREQLATLPLNRRDFLQLSLLAPGVAPPVEDSELSSRGAFAIHASGAREEFNNFLLDGGENNDPYVNRYVVQPPVDAIEEFQIATATYTAEYSRNGGAQMNVVTRRGGAAWHGFLYEYLRNRAFDARNFFDGDTKPHYVRNQFGGGVGGPLRRNSTFLFTSVDALVERQGTSKRLTVPDSAARSGNFAASDTTVLDPFTRIPFPGNRIPLHRLSASGVAVSGLFPEANLAGIGGNFLAQPVSITSQPQLSVRFDHQFGERHQLYARHSYGLSRLYEPFTEDPDTLPGFGDDVRDAGQQLTIGLQSVAGPAVANSLRFSFSRLGRELFPENRDAAALVELALPWMETSGFDSGYPRFNVAGFSALGDATALPIQRTSSTLQVADIVSLVRGAHLLKTGGEFRLARLTSRVGLLTRGSLSFSGALAGNGLADLLLGLPAFALKATADNPIHMRSPSWGAFLQDEWRVRPGLTLSIGARYEYVSAPVDRNNRMTVFNPATGTLAPAGSPGVSRSGLRPDRNNWAPRIGISWQPVTSWVVRAGYGLYYDSGSLLVNTSNYFNPPYFTLRVWFPSATSLLHLASPFPAETGVSPPASLNAVSPDFVTASLQHWSASLQRTIGMRGVLSVAYAGSKGTHLLRARDLNQPPPAPGPVQLRRPLPQYGNILFAESGANSSYHSLQCAFQQRIAGWNSLWASYTWSKSIDSASAFLATRGDRNFPQDSSRAALERSLSSFHLPHRLVAAWTLTLPVESFWARNTSLRGVATAESGRPFTPVLRFDNSNTGNTGGNFGSDRPDLLADPALPNPVAERWFRTEVLPAAPPFHFGSAGRNILAGPSFLSFDLSLVRDFHLHERARLQLEVQAFNLWNRTNFHLPNIWADQPATFGRIFSARAPRQLQFALRWNF